MADFPLRRTEALDRIRREKGVGRSGVLNFLQRTELAASLETVPSAIGASIQASNAMPTDLNYLMDADEQKRLVADLPDHQKVPLLETLAESARSGEHADFLKGKWLHETQQREDLMADGVGSGIALTMGAAMLDPAFAPLFLIPGAFFSRGTRMTRGLKGAGVGGLAGATQEGILAHNMASRDSDDVVFAMMAGITLGGALGSALPGSIKTDAAKPMQRSVDAGIAETQGKPKGDTTVIAADSEGNLVEEVVKVDSKRATGGTPEAPKRTPEDDIEPQAIPQDDTTAGAKEVPGVGFDPGFDQKEVSLLDNLADDAPYSRFAGASGDKNVRFDVIAQGGSSPNPKMRAFTFSAYQEPVAFDRAGYTQTQDAYAMALQIDRTTRSDAAEQHFLGYRAWAQANGYWSSSLNLGKKVEFNKKVTAALRGETTGDEHVNKVAEAYSRQFDEWRKLANESGVFDEIPANAHYVPRIWALDTFQEMVGRFGLLDARGGLQAGLGKMIRGALRAEQLDDQLADALAIALSRRFHRMGNGMDMGHVQGLDLKDTDFLRQLLEESGAKGEKLDQLMSLAEVRANKPSLISRAKHRIDLDENHVTRLVDTDTGEVVDVRMSDLFQNDIESLVQDYGRGLSGAIALQRKLGTNGTLSDVNKLANEMRAYGADLGVDKKQLDSDDENLRFMVDTIAGRPVTQNPGSYLATASRRLRAFSFARFMIQTGFAQVAEIGNMIAFAGWKNTLKSIPVMTRLIRDARTGQIKDRMARDLIRMTGQSMDDLLHPAATRVEDMGTALPSHLRTSKIDRYLEIGKKVVGEISGMGIITRVTQRWAMRGMAFKMMDWAKGRVKIPEADLARLREAGISDKAWTKVERALKKYVVEGEEGLEFDVTAWSKGDPDSLSVYSAAMQRYARRIIQENDPAALAKWMHSDLGKMAVQFRTFSLNAYTKQTLNGIHHKDAIAYLTLQWSMMMASMAYVAQTSINFANDPEELEKRLSLTAIAKASFARAGSASMIPGMVDPLAALATGSPVFNVRTTGLPSATIGSVPIVNLADKAIKTLGTTKNLGPGYQFSRSDYYNATGLVPILSSFLGMANAHRAIAKDLPKSSKVEDNF